MLELELSRGVTYWSPLIVHYTTLRHSAVQYSAVRYLTKTRKHAYISDVWILSCTRMPTKNLTYIVIFQSDKMCELIEMSKWKLKIENFIVCFSFQWNCYCRCLTLFHFYLLLFLRIAEGHLYRIIYNAVLYAWCRH